MKKVFILSILVLIVGQIFGQKPLSGAYDSPVEFKNKKPKYSDSFIIIRRTTGDIKAIGGNDYKIESTNGLITKTIIKKELWGVYKNDTLYLNGIPITGLIWYAKVEILGKYCFLRPSFPANQKVQKELSLNDPQYGYMFGAVGGAIQGGQMAVKRIPLIYNIETGEKMLLCETNIVKILNNYPDLKGEFEKELDKSSDGILLRYLIKINEQEK